MLQSFSRTVDKMPFAGKYTLQPAFRAYIRSKPGGEAPKFTGMVGLLGLFVVGHAYQAKLGIDTFGSHLQAIQETGDIADNWLIGVDALYAAANAAVTTRQIALVGEANKMRNWRGARKMAKAALVAVDPSGQPVQKEFKRTRSERLIGTARYAGAFTLACAVTLGGQYAMLGSSVDAQKKVWEADCVKSANHDLAGYVTQRGVEVTMAEQLRRQYVAVCDVEENRISSIPDLLRTGNPSDIVIAAN